MAFTLPLQHSSRLPELQALCWVLGTWTNLVLCALKVLSGEPDQQEMISQHVRVNARWRAKRSQGKLPEAVASALGPRGGGDAGSRTLQQGAPRALRWGDLGAAEGTPSCPAPPRGGEAGVLGGAGGGVWPSPEGSESPVGEFRGPDHDQERWLDCPVPPVPGGLAGTTPHPHTPLHWPEEERGPRLHRADQLGPGSL